MYMLRERYKFIASVALGVMLLMELLRLPLSELDPGFYWSRCFGSAVLEAACLFIMFTDSPKQLRKLGVIVIVFSLLPILLSPLLNMATLPLLFTSPLAICLLMGAAALMKSYGKEFKSLDMAAIAMTTIYVLLQLVAVFLLQYTVLSLTFLIVESVAAAILAVCVKAKFTEAPVEKTVVCPSCGTANEPGTLICEGCGDILKKGHVSPTKA